MNNGNRRRRLTVAGACATSLVALVVLCPSAAGSRSAAAVANVAVLTTHDFRVAVVATRLGDAATSTAHVRVGLARRIGGRWREFGETRLRESYFWHTVSGPRAVCRLAINTASQRSSRPHVSVQLLQSPSLGCARTYRIALPAS